MNNLDPFLFYLFSSLSLVSALAVVLLKKPVYAVLSLCITIVSLAGLFILLKAHFIAVIQVLIYAGAILVLFLFVIMLLGLRSEESQRRRKPFAWILTFLIAGSFGAEMVFILRGALLKPENPISQLTGHVEAIGQLLFSKYLLPFELISIILLIAVLGVVGLAHKEEGIDS